MASEKAVSNALTAFCHGNPGNWDQASIEAMRAALDAAAAVDGDAQWNNGYRTGYLAGMSTPRERNCASGINLLGRGWRLT